MTETPPTWIRSASDAVFFDLEQSILSKCWTLVGLASDVPMDKDWFRATLGTRSIFVQRFGNELRGFENICSHRFHPLRTQNQGNGNIRCGFHHWQYNKDGVAVGIPKCEEMFGVLPRALNASLNPVEIATCGTLIFARFPSPDHKETLKEYLGEGFPILDAMWSSQRKPRYSSVNVNANWKLGFHISLDDYHLVAVHPDTFGKNGYLPSDAVRYFKFGKHSAYFYGATENGLNEMSEECRMGKYRPSDYRILQFFPNLVAVHFQAAGNWFVLIQQYVPVLSNRTALRSWLSLAPFPPNDRNFRSRMTRKISAPFIPFIAPLYIRKIVSEDNRICEQLQTVASQVRTSPMYGRHETRISWFEEAYASEINNLQ